MRGVLMRGCLTGLGVALGVLMAGMLLAACGGDHGPADPVTDAGEPGDADGQDAPGSDGSHDHDGGDSHDHVEDSRDHSDGSDEHEHGDDDESHDPSEDTADGQVIDAPNDDGTAPSDSPPPTLRIEITDGQPVGGIQRPSVSLGESVTIEVFGNTDDEVHVHGYDLFVHLVDGEGSLTFDALIPGRFEIELERTHRLVAELTVS